MPTRVAINGFGRVGRSVLRIAHEQGADIEIVAINDLTDAITLAHLLRHDSVYGAFPAVVESTENEMLIDGRPIRVLAEPQVSKLPWSELEVDVAIESTGRHRTRAAAAEHLAAGAHKVIISAPAKGSEPVDATVIIGVNFEQVYQADRHHIISNASCTTNCLAPVASVLHETVGIRHGQMSTIHAYTADQNLLLLFLVVRGTPALLLYRRVLDARERMALALLTATQLPLVIAITTLATEDGHMRRSTAAALVGAAVLSTLVFPILGLRLRGDDVDEAVLAESPAIPT
jgi:glyceraldehyde-3-phosphate dehydrogenase/erythrose-4-phosphate dehydrogenase